MAAHNAARGGTGGRPKRRGTVKDFMAQFAPNMLAGE